MLGNIPGFERERIKSKYILILLSNKGYPDPFFEITLKSQISSPGQPNQNIPLLFKHFS